MARFWVVSRKQWRLGLVVLITILVVAVFWRVETMKLDEEQEEVLAEQKVPQVHYMVTGEFKSTLDNGEEAEVYVFYPSTIHAEDGDLVELHIRGLNGKQHDFEIEGLNIKGSVLKNKETIVTFKAKEGTYRIVCYTHADAAHAGPMVGYIVVD